MMEDQDGLQYPSFKSTPNRERVDQETNSERKTKHKRAQSTLLLRLKLRIEWKSQRRKLSNGTICKHMSQDSRGAFAPNKRKPSLSEDMRNLSAVSMGITKRSVHQKYRFAFSASHCYTSCPEELGRESTCESHVLQELPESCTV